VRNDYFQEALKVVDDPYILINMIWSRVRMLRTGNPPVVESPDGLANEDIAMREIIEGRITYVLGDIVVLDEIVGLRPAVKSAH
jgi:DNA-directed RNA polymerase subunit omega